jgi:hypothetical protein
MTAQKYLFVGGVHDGDWLEIPGDPPPLVLRFHKYSVVPPPLEQLPNETEEYELRRFWWGQRGIGCYYSLVGVGEVEPDREVIQKLLAGPPGDRPVTCEPDHVVG